MKKEAGDIVVTPGPAVTSASCGDPPVKTGNIIITPKATEIILAGLDPTVWISDIFAQDWFADALREARTGRDHNARRREIVMSACFAESYMFEWVRQKVQIEEINDYFPPSPRFRGDPRHRRSLKAKWRDIPKELHEAGKIPSVPIFDFSGFEILIRYRNGLIHAAASRPATDLQIEENKPFPTKGMLKDMEPGWAVRVIVGLVTTLHRSMGDRIPGYIENP